MENKIRQIRNGLIFDKNISELLKKWLIYIEIKREDIDVFMKQFRDIFLSDMNIYEVEKSLHKLIRDINVNGSIEKCLEIEEDLVFSEIRPYIADGNTLDIGTGSGKIAEKINNEGFPTTIIDVLDFNKSKLKLLIYDGQNIPFMDNEFSNVTLLTVLHHCDHYNDVLNEAIRVGKDNIIIIESVFTNEDEYYANMFFDWLWNRVVYQNVNVPFNFYKPQDWEKMFEAGGLTVNKSIDLGYDSPMTPEHHWLFVLKKQNQK